MVALGLLEGLAEATSLVTKVFSGWLSDRLGHRKWLTVAGYALAALTKPAFPLAESAGPVFAARFVDRLGKGVRGAPRDALVADLAPAAPARRGVWTSSGPRLRRRGARSAGRGAADAVVRRRPAYRAVVRGDPGGAGGRGAGARSRRAGALAPPPPGAGRRGARPPIGRADLRRLPPRFWSAAALGAAFVVARLPEAFLVVRGHEAGLALAWVPILMVVMNAVYAASAYPAGAASDRLGTRGLLLAGLVVLARRTPAWRRRRGVTGVLAGAAAWGLHLGLTQGLLARLVADAVPGGAARHGLRRVRPRDRRRHPRRRRARRPAVAGRRRTRDLRGRRRAGGCHGDRARLP